MCEAVKSKKTKNKQDATLGKSAKVAIWAALISALGTFFATGLPDIMRLFSSRPPLEQVQDMIANQADKLTAATNRNVEALQRQQKALEAIGVSLSEQRAKLARLTGCVNTIRDVMRDCCTRRVPSVRDRLLEKPEKEIMEFPEPVSVLKNAIEDKGSEEEPLQKVAPMSRPWQQQVQVQEE